jgi:amino acid transporter
MAQAARPGELRRELRFWEAVALSIGILGPTMAAGLNGVSSAGHVGKNVPFSYLVAFIAVGFVAYGFVKLTSRFNNAGSVYGLAGATLGPRAGFAAGWTLLGAYVVFAGGTIAATGLFGSTFLDTVSIWPDANWLVVSLVAAAIIAAISYGDVRGIARALIGLELVSVAMVTVLVVTIFVRVIDGHAPHGQSFTLSPFSPSGLSLGAVALGTVFAFLSFAGFEGAAALGEETAAPRRNVPRALIWATGLIGVFFLIVMFAETLGYGADAAGVKAFSSSSNVFGDLAPAYLSQWFSDLITAGLTFSAFASALGCVAGAMRILFALGRDGFGHRSLGEVSDRTGAPVHALAVIMVIAVVTVIGHYAAGTHNATNVYFYQGTIGTLLILVAYGFTSVGALRQLFFAERETPRWAMAIPLLAIAILAYVLYKNVIPVPPTPYNRFPYIAGAWILVGVLVVVLQPRLAARIGTGLVRDEGLQPDARKVPA